MTKRRSKSAADLLTELNADPEFVASQREKARVRAKQEAEFRRAEEPIVAALNSAGIHVESVSDMPGASYSHLDALPILVEHLQRPYPERIREGIARALAVPEARIAWDALLHSFESDDDTAATGVKWFVGCAIAAAATDDVVGDVIRLFRDTRHGANRLAFVAPLAKSRDPRALDSLLQLREDPQLGPEIGRALRQTHARQKALAKRNPAHHGDESVAGLSEVSMNFDSSLVGPFMARVAQLVSGLGATEIAQVTQLIDDLDVESEGEIHFNVVYQDQTVPLRILIFMDDVDAPDLYFLTAPALAARLEELTGDDSCIG